MTTLPSQEMMDLFLLLLPLMPILAQVLLLKGLKELLSFLRLLLLAACLLSLERSDAGSVSMDETMSTCQSLKSPEIEYMDNIDAEAFASLERRTSNKLYISEHSAAESQGPKMTCGRAIWGWSLLVTLLMVMVITRIHSCVRQLLVIFTTTHAWLRPRRDLLQISWR